MGSTPANHHNKRNHSTNKQIHHQQSTNHNTAPPSNQRSASYQPTKYSNGDDTRRQENHDLEERKNDDDDFDPRGSDRTKHSTKRDNFDTKRDNFDTKRDNFDDTSSTTQAPPAPRKRAVDHRAQAENYKSEYESLCIRCEAMVGEEQTVMETVEKVNRDITQHTVRSSVSLCQRPIVTSHNKRYFFENYEILSILREN